MSSELSRSTTLSDSYPYLDLHIIQGYPFGITIFMTIITTCSSNMNIILGSIQHKLQRGSNNPRRNADRRKPAREFQNIKIHHDTSKYPILDLDMKAGVHERGYNTARFNTHAQAAPSVKQSKPKCRWIEARNLEIIELHNRGIHHDRNFSSG